MDFEQLQRSWQHLGATDPRWAILSEPGREAGGWDDAAFWGSGVQCVAWIARHLEGLQALPARGRALDFGCGHGRLTQALAPHFAEVVGVDVAESMLAAARAHNRHGDRVAYLHNPRADLALFGDASFDFVLTLIVLQHMRPDYAATYLREFLRVLRPGGILLFQIPVERLAPVPVDGAAAGAAAVPPFELRAFTTLLPTLLDLVEDEWHWFRVTVHNAGPRVLPARGPAPVAVGLRFERTDGSAASPTVFESLPGDLAPGAAASLLVPLRAPAAAGTYVAVALPCVGGAWLAHPGNQPAASRVVVSAVPPGRLVPPAAPPRPGPRAAPGAGALIEVHGTSLGDLHEILVGAGGAMLDVGLDAWAGYEWVSAHCVVRKR